MAAPQQFSDRFSELSHQYDDARQAFLDSQGSHGILEFVEGKDIAARARIAGLDLERSRIAASFFVASSDQEYTTSINDMQALVESALATFGVGAGGNLQMGPNTTPFGMDQVAKNVFGGDVLKVTTDEPQAIIDDNKVENLTDDLKIPWWVWAIGIGIVVVAGGAAYLGSRKG